MRSRFLAVAALVALIVVVLAACAPAAPPAPTPTPKPAAAAPTAAAVAPTPTPAPPRVEKVKLGLHGTSLSHAAFVIAMAKGYFKEEGLDVEVVPFASGPDMLSSVAASQIDSTGGVSLSPGLFNALLQGIPIKIVAADGVQSKDFSHNGFVVRKDLVETGRWKGWPSLKGLTFNWMIKGGSILDIWMDYIMQKNGLTRKDFGEAYVEHAASLAGYANKAIDVGLLVEPLLTKAIEDGLVEMIGRAYDEAPNLKMSGVILYSPDLATKRPEVGRKLMMAMLKGARDYTDALGPKGRDTEAIIKPLAEFTKMDPALFKKMMARKTIVGLDPNGTIDVNDVQTFHDLFVREGAIKGKVDFKSAVDSQFLDYALSKLGQYK